MDSKLLNNLYRAYYKEIYLYLYSLCRLPALAEDLTQDTFLKALLSLKDSHSNMRAWLYMVARNLYFNHRKAQNHIADTELSDLDAQTDEDILSALIQKEQNRLLYLALNRLSQNKREVLMMHYFGGLAQREIAAVLNLTPSNVRVLTMRARQELKQYLEVYDDDIS